MLARHQGAHWYADARKKSWDTWTERVLATDDPGEVERMLAAVLPLYTAHPDRPDVSAALAEFSTHITADLVGLQGVGERAVPAGSTASDPRTRRGLPCSSWRASWISSAVPRRHDPSPRRCRTDAGAHPGLRPHAEHGVAGTVPEHGRRLARSAPRLTGLRGSAATGMRTLPRHGQMGDLRLLRNARGLARRDPRRAGPAVAGRGGRRCAPPRYLSIEPQLQAGRGVAYRSIMADTLAEVAAAEGPLAGVRA